ncbi:hypothetical protein F7725_014929 [Dissostichus mawsoni]|uniref:Uncharacterized protein n=1 Tax=Dissostichus mawsoni TaxID=36200 RepID=A0A7J5YG29_DISMA|nr:hypothetical protein F7725_014929 [Dissostichus mawsoni]
MYLSIMKGLPTLLLLCSTALLCSAAPAVEPVTCSEDGGAAAARMAAHHIDENHNHGYKFKLSEIKGNKVEKEVMANCFVRISVRNGDARVRNYHCDTRKVKTDSEMVMLCPDCSNLISLHDPDGMKSVKEAVQRVNRNPTNQNYFILKDVGRIETWWILGMNMHYGAEIALVESHCPMGSRILPEACKPLCPDRARHAFCRSSCSKSEDSSLLSAITTLQWPKDTVGLPAPPAGDGPPEQERQRHMPPFHSFHCHGSDAAIHPICPWPRPEPRGTA